LKDQIVSRHENTVRSPTAPDNVQISIPCLLEGPFECDTLRVTPTVALDFSGDDKLVGVEILGRSGVDIVSVLLAEAPVVAESEEARPGVISTTTRRGSSCRSAPHF
jgi:hypothetical protein